MYGSFWYNVGKKNYVIMLTITIMIGKAPIFYDSKVLITLKMS